MDVNLLIVVIIGLLPLLCKKIIMKNLTATEYFLYFSVISFIFTIVLTCYKYFVEKEKIQFNKLFKFTKESNKILLLLIFIIILKFATGYTKLKFIKEMQLSTYAPIVKSLVIVTSVIFGVLIFNEKKKLRDYIGVGLIIAGIVSMTDYNYTKNT